MVIGAVIEGPTGEAKRFKVSDEYVSDKEGIDIANYGAHVWTILRRLVVL